MASKYWLGTTSVSWSPADNWAATSGGAPGDGKPGAGDDVFFDSAGDNPCTLDEATAAINSLTVLGGGSAYTATLDFNDFAVDITGGGDATFSGSGTIDCGASTITCDGNWASGDQAQFGTWIRGTSLVVLTGTSKTYSLRWSSSVGDLQVDGTITHTGSAGGGGTSTGTLTINGTFTINQLYRVRDGNVVNNGTLDGPSQLWILDSLVENNGTWNVSLTKVLHDATIKTSTFGGNWLFETTVTRTVTFETGVVFEGDVAMNQSGSSSHTFTIDFATNDASVEFQRDLSLTESGAGTLTWSKAATGTVTFGGTTEYTDDTVAIQNLGNVDVDGTSLKLLTEMECDDFTLTSGAFDINGQILDVGGNMDWTVGSTITDPVGGTFEVAGIFTANAQDISGATGEWWLKVSGGSAIASGVGDVKYCNAGGFLEIDASSGPWVDSGNNTNWDFGVDESTIQLPTLQIAI